MEKTRSIKMVCRKIRLQDRDSDVAYWRGQPVEARLDALEEIRREYHLWRYGAEPRLERVCTIAKR